MVTANSFETLTDFGTVDVQVTNEGNLTAAFYVSIIECSDNIREVEETKTNIEKESTVHVKFRLFANSGKGNLEKCKAVLKDATGTVVSMREFSFTTTDQYFNTFENSTNDQYINWSTGEACDNACTEWYMIFCFISYVLPLTHNRVVQIKSCYSYFL
jgi:hypothetical protein